MDLRFLSSNKFKIAETESILKPVGINIIPVNIKIEELQTLDTERLVKDKILKAFKIVGRPLFVEHTGLYLEHLNGFPGGLTQIFWDTIEADKFSQLFGIASSNKVIAQTIIGYCDGKQIHFFKGSVNGTISNIPIGDRAFQWDCVFIPDGYTETFAELEDKKNEISMRRIALDNFCQYFKNTK